MKTKIIAVVLAVEGGEGSRFRGLAVQPFLGTSLIRLALEKAAGLGPAKVYLATDLPPQEVAAEIPGGRGFLLRPRRTSGEVGALLAARPVLRKSRAAETLAIPVRFPLLDRETLKALLRRHRAGGNALTILSSEAEPAHPLAYVFRRRDLLDALDRFSRRRAGDAPLEALVEDFILKRKKVGAFPLAGHQDFLRVEDGYDLARAATFLRDKKIREVCRRGVVVLDPATVWMDMEVRIGEGTVVYPSVVIEGECVIGKNCRILPHVHIVASRIGDNVRILASSVLEDCEIQEDVQVGPFSRLRPRTVLKPGSRVGNFVEMKNTAFGPRSKALHLSYLGDSEVDEDVNIGAGTITCNYDGVRKNKTVVEAGVFIGSGTELVAPVTVGRGAYIGAGSTITKDVAPGSLAIARARQVEKPGWAARRRAKK